MTCKSPLQNGDEVNDAFRFLLVRGTVACNVRATSDVSRCAAERSTLTTVNRWQQRLH